MRILNRLGGIELSSAYACIKAISKKKHDIIDALGSILSRFANVVWPRTRPAIFDLVNHRDYGFSRLHSAAYAYVSYQTAYLKAHYTPEFMAALLTSEIDDGNKRDIMVRHFEDTRKLGYRCSRRTSTRIWRISPNRQQPRAVRAEKVVKGLGPWKPQMKITRPCGKEERSFKDLFDFANGWTYRIVAVAAASGDDFSQAMTLRAAALFTNNVPATRPANLTTPLPCCWSVFASMRNGAGSSPAGRASLLNWKE